MERANAERYDVAIVGAGPAGLSAALILGRCCRSVFVCDAGTPRSGPTRVMHGFLTRDGVEPAEFRRLAREELGRYANVTLRDARAVGARRQAAGFELRLQGGARLSARKLLIATGVADELPPLEGLRELYGTSVFHCPYCDAYELRGQPVAAYGRRQRGLELARALTGWTSDVTLFSDGPSGLGAEERRRLARNAVRLVEDRVARLVGHDGQLEAVVLACGRELRVRALFFDAPARAQSLLAQRVGCRLTAKGGVRCGQYEASDVPGVFVAGNITKDVQLSIVAAAEGARAAFGIHRSLLREAFERRATGRRTVEHPPVDDAETTRRRGRSSGASRRGAAAVGSSRAALRPAPPIPRKRS
jgi:thioredoxin reductase